MGEQETMGPIGACLRKVRQERNLSLEEISRITKISKRYLAAIENDDFDQLPAPTFARGFIRAYAAFVGVESEEIVQQYRERYEGLQKEDMVPLDSRLDGLRIRRIAVAAVILVVFVGALLWLGRGEKRETQPDKGEDTKQIDTLKEELGLQGNISESDREGGEGEVKGLPGEVVETKESVVEEEGAEPAKDVSGIELKAVATDKTWIMITIDDASAKEFMIEKGRKLQWDADERITIKVGNAGGVNLFLNGAPLEPLGPAGVVKTATFTRESVERLGLTKRNGTGSDD